MRVLVLIGLPVLVVGAIVAAFMSNRWFGVFVVCGGGPGCCTITCSTHADHSGYSHREPADEERVTVMPLGITPRQMGPGCPAHAAVARLFTGWMMVT